MKKSIIFTIFFHALLIAKAQYNPMPMSNFSWMTMRMGIDINGHCFTRYHFYVPEVDYDTLINTYNYSKIYLNSFHDNLSGYYGSYRQDINNQKVFFVSKDSLNEYLLYDFSINIGDTIKVIIPRSTVISDSLVDLVVYDVFYDNGRKNIFLYHGGFPTSNLWSSYYWIEGIGSISGLNVNQLYNFNLSYFDWLQCFNKNDTTFYNFNYCTDTVFSFDTSAHQTCQTFNNSSIYEQNKLSASIYPNPTQYIINIETSFFENSKCKIFDITGKLLYESILQQNLTQIDMSSFAEGIYLIQINSNNILLNEIIIKNYRYEKTYTTHFYVFVYSSNFT